MGTVLTDEQIFERVFFDENLWTIFTLITLMSNYRP